MIASRSARTFLAVALLAAVPASASGLPAHSPAGKQAGKPPARIVFPIVGKATFYDDFGEPRGQGSHDANDIVAERRAPVVAVEDGKVRFWTTSSRAGCMLYLYGSSGTTYYYIHLNNDLGKRNDNRGKCVPGVAYAPGLKNGQNVVAGQLVAYVGDSGDADGLHPHLHFELRPNGGKAVSPYRSLRRAHRLVFAAEPARPRGGLSLSVTGRVMEVVSDGSQRRLRIRAAKSTLSTGLAFAPARQIVFALPSQPEAARDRSGLSALESIKPGDRITVTTSLRRPLLRAQIAAPLALVAETVAVEPSR